MDNLLIKKKLKSILKNKEIKGNEKLMGGIDKECSNYLDKILELLSYEIITSGKKTANLSDLKKVIEKLEKPKSFEI